ncbi:MAG: hypothetical protein ACI9XP_001978 [Lentimonas sp.]
MPLEALRLKELEEILAVDEELTHRFESLTLGMKRYILYYVLQIKSSDKQTERSLFLLNNLVKTVPSKETFRLILGKED